MIRVASVAIPAPQLLECICMQQSEPIAQSTVEQLPWEAPELVAADVSAVTQANGGVGADGSLESS